MKFFLSRVVCASVLLIFSSGAFAAEPKASPAATPPACQQPEFRAFDFWIGKWQVRNAKGDLVGTNEISRVAGDCALREQWSGAKGMKGISVNYYDPADRHWHQHWVGSDGVVLDLKGNVESGAMIMSDLGTTKAGVANKIVWTSLPEGKVKQEWFVSKDRGQTWSPVFAGVYEKES